MRFLALRPRPRMTSINVSSPLRVAFFPFCPSLFWDRVESSTQRVIVELGRNVDGQQRGIEDLAVQSMFLEIVAELDPRRMVEKARADKPDPHRSVAPLFQNSFHEQTHPLLVRMPFHDVSTC